MEGVRIRKDGKNIKAMVIGPFWYINKRMYKKGIILLLIVILTLGAGLIPVWVYCSYNANRDLYKYIKKRGYYIYH